VRFLGSWRPSLRMARRDALRSRGRSILVLVMIALPVLAVTAADVVIQTSTVSGDEALDRRLGQADARVSFEPGTTRVWQSFDPDNGNYATSCCRGPKGDRDLGTIGAALGRQVTGLAAATGEAEVRTDKGIGYAEASETDLRDPLARGMYTLVDGELPSEPGQVVITPGLADRGFVVGDRLELVEGSTLEVVGIVDSTTYRDVSMLVGLPGSLGLPRHDLRPEWFVDAGPVLWADVQKLNEIGATVLSRSVMLDPPPDSELPSEVSSGSTDDAMLAVIVLIVVMALIEVVLLAGPAFAVGARRQSRNLALMAASGGTPAQARRVVLASGIVLGTAGAVLGVGLGIGVGWAVLPIVQRYSSAWLGPFDVPWLHLLGIAAFGLLSAFLAAVVPAWIASRQDVVAVLAGRRGDRKPNLRSPVLGLVLLAIGIGVSVYGARGVGGEFAIAFAAIPSVLGMILLIPLVVVGLARLAARFPLTLRYAARDAARHRTRTVPAVAAVAATVAGVVALGIANSSDEAESRGTYHASLPLGQAAVTSYDPDPTVLPRAKAIVEREIPGATVTQVQGVPETLPDQKSLNVDLRVVGGRRDSLLDQWSSPFGTSFLVSDGSWPDVLATVLPADLPTATRALARGEVVVFVEDGLDAGEVRLGGQRDDRPRGERRIGPLTVPATFVRVEPGQAQAVAVLPRSVAHELDLPVAPTALSVTGADVTKAQETDVSEGLAALSQNMGFYVERGYQQSDETVIVLLVLAALGAVLMLGGTLTATFLALSDARPDLATLSAVGASPRSRRGVASAYAAVVGLVGAALGAAVGFIPGVAVTYPLTSYSGGFGGEEVGPFLDIPWLLIGTLVVVLPLLTALIVGLTARSRLPLVARVD
jgi:putative ABC transport system permease protein